MTARTFAIGDIHGDLDALRALLAKLPALDGDDTVVFLGDYVDRGPQSREVVRVVRAIDRELGCRSIALRGNHEDAWLRVIERGWPEFVLPASNGALATMRSYTGGPAPRDDESPQQHEWEPLMRGSFLPADVIEWFEALPFFYEDDHAIYVHAGVPRREGRWLHPSEVDDPRVLVWTRSEAMFREYDRKRLVIGHTTTDLLPPELSHHTPADPTDLWASDRVLALDTGCGKGGFLTAIELPSLTVYESR